MQASPVLWLPRSFCSGLSTLSSLGGGGLSVLFVQGLCEDGHTVVSLFAGGGVLGRPENRLGPFSSNPGTLRYASVFFIPANNPLRPVPPFFLFLLLPSLSCFYTSFCHHVCALFYTIQGRSAEIQQIDGSSRLGQNKGIVMNDRSALQRI